MTTDATENAEPLPLEGYEDLMTCPICEGGPAQSNCSACAGRGAIDAIPYPERGWDEVAPGLWLGGHESQDGYHFPRDEFDVVVSMTRVPGARQFEPSEGVRHYIASIRDEGQDVEEIAQPLDHLATKINGHLKQGDKVLVRCWAGLNRASLVVGLVLIQQGWSAEQAMAWLRHKRSPYVLFNASFAAHLRSRG